MDSTQSPASELKNSSTTLRPEVEARSSSKKRSMAQKVVVRVKVGEGDGCRKRKSEGPPSDRWSWRKYGQKPIKGSPHPRGYYRCSSSKGCSAKKQVERSRRDASVLIITYTSTHNHPATIFREEPPAAEDEEEEEESLADEDNPTTPVLPGEEEAEMEHSRSRVKDKSYEEEEDSFHYSQSPFNTSEDIIIINPEDNINLFTQTLGTNYDHQYYSPSSLLLDDGEPLLSYPHLMDDFSTPKSHDQENDFYDELEELPFPPATSSGLHDLITYTFFKLAS